MDMKVSSGIDWFDVQVSASWGDQEINFRDIKSYHERPGLCGTW